MKYTQSKKGFTIIETSLVLAIAGLILVMAFVALPALQRQTRDAKRKEDAATFMQALTKYQENNRGQLPASNNFNAIDVEVKNSYGYKSDAGINVDWNNVKDNSWYSFYSKYLGDNFNNPDGGKYRFVVTQCHSGSQQCPNNILSAMKGTWYGHDEWRADWYVFVGATCGSDNWPAKSANGRNVAIIVMLEGGHTCIDN